MLIKFLRQTVLTADGGESNMLLLLLFSKHWCGESHRQVSSQLFLLPAR